MKHILSLLMLVSCGLTAQNLDPNHFELPYTNNEAAEVVVFEFISKLQESGYPEHLLNSRLKDMDSVVVKYYDEPVSPLSRKPSPGVYYFNGLKGWIKIHKSMLDNDEFAKLRWVLFHELAHHFGVQDCNKCNYNIMSDKLVWPTYLYKNPFNRRVYEDMFFERIVDPDKPHTHY